ncbi:hypothetical protein [Rhodoferax sp.]|uniref:hypothetical protein n=1 Tax=Rhodoferax sp. TaxID=50421 RepID=UPI00262E8562|nr:hypothetical protein [Rhodoferax sp.]
MKRLPIRGGNWNNGASAGVFALNLNNARSNANTNIGARCALGDCQKQQAHAACWQNAPQKDALSLVLAWSYALVKNRKIKQMARSSSALRADVRSHRPSGIEGVFCG